MSATIPSPNIGLYGGMFARNTSGWYDYQTGDEITNQQVASQLAGSGFTTILLWTVGVASKSGDIYFNGSPQQSSPRLASNGTWDPDNYYSSYLPQCLQTLQGSGSSVTNVLFSIGCGAPATDWANITALLGDTPASSVVVQNLQAIYDNLPISGYDFDDEESLSLTGSAVTTLTSILTGMGMMVTWCPYTSDDTWASLLSTVYQDNNNTQLVSWWNLQCYGGGTGNLPSTWSAAITTSESQPTGLTASQAQAFIIPGFDPPTAFGITLQTLSGSNPYANNIDSPLPGAFLWQANSVFGANLNAVAFPNVISAAATAAAKRMEGRSAAPPLILRN